MLDDLKEKLMEYVDTPIDEITPETRFIEDLGLNSCRYLAILKRNTT